MRGAVALTLGLALGWSLGLGHPALAETITRAALIEPTKRYDHGVLGDGEEWGALWISAAAGSLVVRLPENRVFEDVEARIIRLEDGREAILVVESDLSLGASLTLYDAKGIKIASTSFVGEKNRWYAPVGAADFDGDGRVDIAFVDRPHLKRDLVFARREGEKLVEFARLPGLTNHRIGDNIITAGIRDCGTGPEAVLTEPSWSRLMAASPREARDLGPFSPKAMKAALACR